MKRASGMLMHITALPSPYGIGTFGRAAYEFVDFLRASGMRYWQILPITHPSDYGNSPYQAYSSYGVNPLLIDLDMLTESGLLSHDDYAGLDFGPEGRVDFAGQRRLKMPLIISAARRALSGDLSGFNAFCNKEYWLEDYALYMALRASQGDRPWYEWSPEYKFREPAAMDNFRRESRELIDIWKMIQYLALDQWYKLKDYANNKDIEFFGDIPIYVSYDSAEVWAHPELFELDEDRRPVEVAGCPPDAFTDKGQKWGSPLYNYDLMEMDGYNWWINRIDYMCNLYNMLRIDHFRGFESYYAVPEADPDATRGRWRKGPGMKLFNSLNYWMGRKAIVAEDLGTITPEVRQLLSEAGYPGMKVIEFAFDRPYNIANPYLPHNYDKNCVAYIGTHDNATCLEWIGSLPEDTADMVRTYFGEGVKSVIRGLYSCSADLVIITPQDLLELGAEARFNTPGVALGNWEWRLTAGQIGPEDASYLLKLGKAFGR